MEGKDNRSKEKRHKMKQHHHHHEQQRKTKHGTTSSSSTQVHDGVHSIVDVADSSDEPRFARGNGWIASSKRHSHYKQPQPPTQANINRLDLPPPMVDEYDDNDKENAQMCASDFKQLADKTTLGGGHFSFEDEKQWTGENLLKGADEQKFIDANEYFTLNIKQISAGLQTIPFYKRMDYGASMFTREQLNDMNKSAELAEKNYQKCYANQKATTNNSESRVNSAKTAVSAAAANVNDKDELDELLDMTTQQVAKIAVESTKKNDAPLATTAAAADNDDVQNWLDSVLEE